MVEHTQIKMVDLHQQYLNIKLEIDRAIQSVINETAFINGSEVKHFAEQLAIFCRVNHVVTCANGTDALQIALMSLGLKQGDEVILPSFTYVATAEAIALLNLKPVFVDVDLRSYNIDTNKIEKKITNKTRALIPVHLFGQCADMEKIMEISNKYDLAIIEDAAQAIGAQYRFKNGYVKTAGSIGNIGCLSFFPSKNLGCYGDGGAMLINDPDIAKRASMIANHGQKVKYHHELIGCNSRLDTLQAAILLVKLKYIDDYNKRRFKVAEKYNTAFKNLKNLITPKITKESTHVFNQYTIRMNGVDRDKLRTRLDQKGIPTMVYYPIPLHLQKAYRDYEFANDSFPVSERICKEVLSLPIHTELDELQQEFIISSVKETINEIS